MKKYSKKAQKLRNVVNEKSINHLDKKVKILADEWRRNNIRIGNKTKEILYLASNQEIKNKCGHNIQEFWNMTKRLRNHRIEYGAEFKLNAQKTYSVILQKRKPKIQGKDMDHNIAGIKNP